jgi:hypothetical protein
MELPSSLDGKVADPFYLIVSLGTPLALTPSRRRQIIGEMPRRLIVNWSTRDDGALGMVPRVYRMTSRAPDFSCCPILRPTLPQPGQSDRHYSLSIKLRQMVPCPSATSGVPCQCRYSTRFREVSGTEISGPFEASGYMRIADLGITFQVRQDEIFATPGSLHSSTV